MNKFFRRCGSSRRVVFYNFEVFWYLMAKKLGILVSHYSLWLGLIEASGIAYWPLEYDISAHC